MFLLLRHGKPLFDQTERRSGLILLQHHAGAPMNRLRTIWPRIAGQPLKPNLGRFVVFQTTDFSYHGHPDPLTSPPDRMRRSVAFYYYTRSRPSSECVHGDCFDEHSTLFKTIRPGARRCPRPTGGPRMAEARAEPQAHATRSHPPA